MKGGVEHLLRELANVETEKANKQRPAGATSGAVRMNTKTNEPTEQEIEAVLKELKNTRNVHYVSSVTGVHVGIVRAIRNGDYL